MRTVLTAVFEKTKTMNVAELNNLADKILPEIYTNIKKTKEETVMFKQENGITLANCPIRHLGTEKSHELYKKIEEYLLANKSGATASLPVRSGTLKCDVFVSGVKALQSAFGTPLSGAILPTVNSVAHRRG